MQKKFFKKLSQVWNNILVMNFDNVTTFESIIVLFTVQIHLKLLFSNNPDGIILQTDSQLCNFENIIFW